MSEKRNYDDEQEQLDSTKRQHMVDTLLQANKDHDADHGESSVAAAAAAAAAYRELIREPEDDESTAPVNSGEAGDDKDDKNLEKGDELDDRERDEQGEGEEEEEEEEEEDENDHVDMDDVDKDPDAVIDEEDEEDEEDEGRDKNGERLRIINEGEHGVGSAARRRGRKPAPETGSTEWRKQRKDSHKEVERRRRQNINTAIDKLSDLLPVKESSKAAILSRAAEYIQKMKETETANIEKWTLQKLLGEQQVSSLSSANEKLEHELSKAYKTMEELKKKLKDAGVEDTEN